MAMSWEEIANSRMQEIHRLRAVICCSKLDSFIVEHAIRLYNLSKKTFYGSRSTKAEDAPLSECDIKRLAEMEIIADFIAALDVMDRAEFLEQANTYAKSNETGE